MTRLALRKTLQEKDAQIANQSQRIADLDRKANPQRYRLSSGAELVKLNVPNYNNSSLHIWTRVGDELFDDTKFQIDYNLAQQHFNHIITDEEFVNAVFEPQEQVSPAQTDLLDVAAILATGGPARPVSVQVPAARNPTCLGTAKRITRGNGKKKPCKLLAGLLLCIDIYQISNHTV